MFDAIVLSNGWDDATVALQLLSHLEGDALNVALLVPAPRRASRVGLVDALTAHYGSPGRLADYWRQYEKTTRTAGEDPSIFAIALETLAIKAFVNMGQTARLRLFRDRFIAGHNSCELHRHFDSVPPETPIRDIVDQCRVWESHAGSDVRWVSKPGPDPVYPTYVVSGPYRGVDDIRVAAITTPQSTPHQVAETQARQPVPAAATGLAGLETLLRNLLSGNLAPVRQPRPGPIRRNWNAVVCFSCGKAGHSATPLSHFG